MQITKISYEISDDYDIKEAELVEAFNDKILQRFPNVFISFDGTNRQTQSIMFDIEYDTEIDSYEKSIEYNEHLATLNTM